MSECILKSIANPHLNGVLNGLTLKSKHHLTIDKSMFPCCEGVGEAYVSERHVRHCSLKNRMKHLQKTIRALQKLYPQHFEVAQSMSLDPTLLEDLGAISQGHMVKGRVFLGKAQENTVSTLQYLWSYTLAAVWRFGIHVCYADIQHTSIPKLLDELRQDTDAPKMLVLAPVSKLWDAKVLSDFSTIIDFAYNSMLPCWVYMPSLRPAHKKTGKRPTYAERMAGMRAKNPLELLPETSRHRLQSMCDGW